MQSKGYDYKSDIWSLGCVVFEMMALKHHAFDATDMSTLVVKILQVGWPGAWGKEGRRCWCARNPAIGVLGLVAAQHCP